MQGSCARRGRSDFNVKVFAQVVQSLLWGQLAVDELELREKGADNCCTSQEHR